MIDNEQAILDGLRDLAAEEPRQAPQYVETYLVSAFRRRARRRRVQAWATAAGIGVIAAGIAALLWVAGPALKRAQVVPGAIVAAPAVTGSRPTTPAAERAADVRYAVIRADEVASSFYPLPEADALPPLETAMVVRVQLPLSSLQLMGFPVDEETDADPVEADVLLGQDGLARGVRLIQ
jgi:hypothetical protein